MPASKETRSPLLDPLHSPGSDVPAQPQQLQLQLQQLPASTLCGPTFRQNQATADTMAKTKRRMFSSPLLRRSATASSAAAASAASKIKSNLSTALKRSAMNTGSGSMPSNDDNKANVDRAPTIPSLSTSSTESSAKQHSNKMFSMPSMMRRTGSKEEKTQKSTESDDLKHSTEDKSEQSNNDTSSSSETEGDNDVESTSPEATTQSQKSAINSASRFVMGMPTLLRRAVSNNAPASAAATQKKSPDTSEDSTPRGQFPEDDFEENERHSLLMMMQVPESQRNSLIPLMAVGEAW
ncbi:hypothetical protein PF008_g6623 [Phytophthora fragariae]|uniref:Uncharacterized protein n=1 Tax=Phytophthora fragariae TaxID=53985 RepID=A0A6G0S5G2_9STRA|nr:hypothetical protein PF008_g6623 [Phytophthora fragariae]